MAWLNELWRRLGTLLRRRQFDADLEDEMRLHVELRAEQQAQAGLAPDQARYAARRRFGNVLLLKEASRRMWGWHWLQNLAQEPPSAFPSLPRSPVITPHSFP